MKKAFLHISLIFTSIISVSAQEPNKEYFSHDFLNYDYSEDRAVYVKGYYIISYREQDHIEMRMNEELKRQGRNYYIPIDVHSGAHCYTLQVYNRFLLDSANIAPLLRVCRIISNLEIFKFPPYAWTTPIADLFRKYEGLKERSEEIINKRIDFPDADYYKLENDSLICQIYYIEGWALRTKVETDYLNILNYDKLHPYRLTFPNGSIASFFIYSFYDVDVIDVNRVPAGFVKWEPSFTADDLDQYVKYQKRRRRQR
ncbi:hypothetical protein LJC45_01485 [Alistipes sp. OttesenSCG-928-B03]|nr:hypothetical protein [Alistipes sp. OttesenSCG-928-B03]